jgi:hypothetical protein
MNQGPPNLRLPFSDDDLRGALAPLRGDPQRVAAHVLRALEPLQRRRHRQRPPAMWLVTAAAAGFVLALLIFFLLARASRSGDPKTADRIDPPPPPPIDRAFTEPQLRFVSGGLIRLTAMVKGAENLRAGERLSVDDELGTDAGSVAQVLLPGGTELRIGPLTIVRLRGPGSVQLDAGQLWLRTPRGSEGFEVRGAAGSVVARGGEVLVRVDESSLQAVAFAGLAKIRGTAGEPRPLEPGTTMTASGEQVTGLRKLRDSHAETGWMLPILLQQELQLELAARLRSRLEWILIEGASQVAVEVEVRRAGAVGATALIEFITRRDPPPVGPRRFAAELLADVAGVAQAPALFDLLLDADNKVRYFAFGALRRITGRPMPGGDSSHWLGDIGPEQRATAVKWRTWFLGGG